MDFSYIRSRYEEEACKFLHAHFGQDDTLFDLNYFYMDISKVRRKDDFETYIKYLEAFHLLFNSDNEHFKVVLWNEFTKAIKQRFYCSDFSKAEWQFLHETQKIAEIGSRKSKYSIFGDGPNINNSIYTERLILRKSEVAEVPIFRKHFQQDGDFIVYCGLLPTRKNIHYMPAPYGSLHFVLEGKNSHEIMGYVGLSYYEDKQTALLEYYMFKQFRGKGYCKEAIIKLCKEALEGNLVIPIETARKDIYRKKKIKISTVRARIANCNTSSRKTVESCGFIHEATLHNNMYRADIGIVDEEVYYMTKEHISYV